MKKHYPGETYEITRWAIRWTAPADIADSITLVESYQRASMMLGLSFGQAGEVVYQRVTYSPWNNK